MLCEHWGWQTASLTIVDCRALNLSKASWICFCICIARESVSLSLHFSGWKIQDTPYLWQSLSACWKSVFRRNLSVLCIAVRAAMERHGDQCDSRALKDTHKFLICCSFLEIYNEADTPLRIPCGFDDFDGFTLCPCLSYRSCTMRAQIVYDLLVPRGKNAPKTGQTGLLQTEKCKVWETPRRFWRWHSDILWQSSFPFDSEW